MIEPDEHSDWQDRVRYVLGLQEDVRIQLEQLARRRESYVSVTGDRAHLQAEAGELLKKSDLIKAKLEDLMPWLAGE